MTRFILSIALVFSFFWILPQNIFATSWLSGYGYQKVFYITGSTAGPISNYQIKLTLNKGTGSDTNSSFYLDNQVLDSFNDVRFTSSDGTTLLNYWIESSDSTSAVVWVKLDSVPASPSQKTFYLYYGNSAAASLSSGTDTFNFFDDFDANGISSWVGSDQNKHIGESATQTASSLKSVSSPNSAQLYTYANCHTDPWDGVGSILSRTLNLPSGTYKVDFNVLRDILGFRHTTAANERSIVKINGAESFSEFTTCAAGSCGVIGSWASKSFDVINSPIDTLDLEGYSDDCTDGNVWFDNLRVRTYISPEPTLSITASSNNDNSSSVSTSTSTSNFSSSAPICSDARPASTPDLFQIDTTDTSAKLFFTPISNTSQFYISFSEHPNAEEHSESVTLTKEGVQSITVYFLKPRTTYYMKVRGQNGCMPGDWSNIMKFTTRQKSATSPVSFYKYTFKTLLDFSKKS